MLAKIYNHLEIEQKWQNIWNSAGIYNVKKVLNEGKKYYCLDMFPYPSGAGLHVGHVEGYTGTDVVTRYMRMKGYDVLHPMGWDSFGLPAENYAIKTGIHPSITTNNAIQNFKNQIKNLGLSYDWSKEIATSDPEYYKWTQWLFLELYKTNLAYKAIAKVNWCESCQTVLANEQVVDGRCERCGNVVIKKELDQWFFGITKYAEELLMGLNNLDWPESTKMGQRNWIGKSIGCLFEVVIEFDRGDNDALSIFTTRIDTFCGVSFIAIAPENEFWENNKARIRNWSKISEYINNSKLSNDIDRLSMEKEITGELAEGVWYIHPISKRKIPIYVADYVLNHYGSGAVMGVPAHDERDAKFANNFKLEAKEVILGNALINSGEFNGLLVEDARIRIREFVNGKVEVKYRLRDWLISRQRYWGAPIPIVYDPEGNPHAIPDEHLPWLLPNDVEFRPTGTSPLKLSKELLERTERIFGKGWKPEVDTIDTFVCSSWYYLRFVDPHNDHEFANKDALNEWLPVDAYVGGAEHTVLHLLYARFITKALRDMGYLNFDEPFLKLRHQGLVLAEDKRKMSKRWGNVINPDDVVREYGADSVRLYEMFMGPFSDTIPWSNQGLVGCKRFLDKVWQMSFRLTDGKISYDIYELVEKVTNDIDAYKFNTAIAAMMKWINQYKNREITYATWKIFIQLLAPFAPHLTEEFWDKLGNKESIHLSSWPEILKEEKMDKLVNIPVQIDGKLRFLLEVNINQLSNLEQLVMQDPRVLKWVTDLSRVKIIIIPNKIVSIVNKS